MRVVVDPISKLNTNQKSMRKQATCRNIKIHLSQITHLVLFLHLIGCKDNYQNHHIDTNC